MSVKRNAKSVCHSPPKAISQEENSRVIFMETENMTLLCDIRKEFLQ